MGLGGDRFGRFRQAIQTLLADRSVSADRQPCNDVFRNNNPDRSPSEVLVVPFVACQEAFPFLSACPWLPRLLPIGMGLPAALLNQ